MCKRGVSGWWLMILDISLLYRYKVEQSPSSSLFLHNANTDVENKGFPGNLSVKYVWEGRLHNNNVHICACAPVVACGRCAAPPTSSHIHPDNGTHTFSMCLKILCEHMVKI